MTLGEIYIKELEMEKNATRKCLERYKPELSDWKPHEKSMGMGYLALIVAEIPRWISATIETGVIDFATWGRTELKTTEDYVNHFDKCLEGAKKALKGATDSELQEMFYLKNNGVELMKDTKQNTISSSINHLVHHRGQLTVYMRQNGIPVPSIYGPSADDKTF